MLPAICCWECYYVIQHSLNNFSAFRRNFNLETEKITKESFPFKIILFALMVFVHLPAKMKCGTRPFSERKLAPAEACMTSAARNHWLRWHYSAGAPQTSSNVALSKQAKARGDAYLLRPSSRYHGQQARPVDTAVKAPLIEILVSIGIF